MHKEEMIKADNKGRAEEAEMITVAEMDEVLVMVHTPEAINGYMPSQCSV
jgi:hypothetical protein